ncbi:MAG: YqaE/Pmp3 family membrane protein [Bacteroidetes bacterium]|nr:YqaE/Pmp3 family membrane protein [Bacteroidota bacterium]
MTLLLIILCFIIPPVAVGLATNWEITPLVINILLTFLFWLPGVIHALIVVLR